MPKNPKPRRTKPRPRHAPAEAGPADRVQSPAQPARMAALAGSLPLAGFAALAVATCLVPSETPPAFGLEIPLVMGWLLLLVGWAVAGLARRELTIRLDAASVLLLVFFVWLCVSSAVNLGDSRPRATLNMTFRWLSFGVMFFLARQLLVGAKTQRAAVALMLALATGVSAMGVYQYAVTFPAMRASYEADKQQAMANAGVMAPVDSPIGRQFADRVYSTEPLSTFALTNSLAGMIVPWLVIGLALLWHAARRLTKQGEAASHVTWQQSLPLIGLGLGVLLLAFCLILTKSRSAWGAAALGFLLLVGGAIAKRGLRADWKWLAGGGVIVTLLIAAAAAIGALDREVLSEAWKSLSYRGQFWQATAAMIAEHPLVGIGVGNFQEHYAAYKLPAASEMIGDPHNFLLEIAATMGLPALLPLAGGLLLVGWLARASRGHEASRTEATGSAWPLYTGLALGFLLAVPLQAMTVGLGLIAPTLVVIVPVTVLTVVLLDGWVGAGELPRGACSVALLALLVNLLAAGGIGFASVSLHVWLLAALLLAAGPAGGKWFWNGRLSRGWSTAVVAACCLGVAVFYLLAYRPVLHSRLALDVAELHIQQQNYAAAAQPLAVARAADPWNEAAFRLSAVAVQRQWLLDRRPEQFRQFETLAAEAIRLNPQAHTLRAELSHRYLEAYRATGDRRLLARAIEYQQQAIARYPHDSLGHAQLAWLYSLADDPQQAVREAEIALELDRINPHLDRELANQKLFDAEGQLAEGESALETLQKIAGTLGVP